MKTDQKLKEIGSFIKECGSYMETSRRTGIFWLSIRRWATGETKPCLANRNLLEAQGLYVDPKKAVR